MTDAVGAVAKTDDEPPSGAHTTTAPGVDPDETQDVDVDAQEEPCQRCGVGPREELVKISVRDVVWVSEVCRPCAREASQFMQGKA
jgi:hypothetical protein